jgi:hypothetical protein
MQNIIIFHLIFFGESIIPNVLQNDAMSVDAMLSRKCIFGIIGDYKEF